MSNSLRIKKREVFELFLVYSYWILASLFAVKTQIGFTEYIIIFALPPLVYLLTLLGKHSLRILLQSAIIAAIFVSGVDILAHITGAWVISGSIGYTLYVSTIVDNFIWAFLYVALLLAWYKYFFDRYKSYKIDKRLHSYTLLLVGNVVIVAGWLFLFLFIEPLQSFFYASLMAPMVVFTFSTFYFFPLLIKKITLASITAFPAAVLYEYVSLTLDHWSFTGSFLLLIPFGEFYVPIEEFAWFFFAVTFLLCFNELFVDNRK